MIKAPNKPLHDNGEKYNLSECKGTCRFYKGEENVFCGYYDKIIPPTLRFCKYFKLLIKVFIPNKAGHDFSAAEKYGTLIYVSSGTQHKHGTNLMQRQWQDALKNSTKDDIIMMSGLPHMQAIGCALFGHIHGRVNILIYSPEKERTKYILRTNVFEEEKDV